jgi:DNA polymerase
MALHESLLEEFGLAPMWVRRGMAAAQEPIVEAPAETEAEPVAVTGQGAGVEVGPGARHDNAPSAAPGLPPVARAQETARPALRAGEAQSADAASLQSERHAPTRADQAPSSPKRQPQPSQQSRSPEPPTFDAPPDDDFAWFDDLPTQAPANVRQEAPAAPAIHTLDWDALSERVAACQLCRLCEKRTNTVFGVGDRNADWMLIGEAPGENEDRVGEPFVGQAGKLLDNMLRSLTLARDTNVYIANVIKCRPPGNRNPEADEVARCEPYLQRQVALVKPKLIVALGRFAAQSLLKTDASISSLRGRVHEYEGVPVIVTYHPAYLLRSLPDKAKAWADLCLARDTWRAAGGAPSNASK